MAYSASQQLGGSSGSGKKKKAYKDPQNVIRQPAAVKKATKTAKKSRKK